MQPKIKRIRWWLSVLIAIDQLLNALLWGWPDETLSSRCHRMDGKKRRWTYSRKAIDWVFLVVFKQEDHCYKSFLTEKELHQMPVEVRHP